MNTPNIEIRNAKSVEETLELMKAKLSQVVPAEDLAEKAELVFLINSKKREMGAVILGHNYMEPVLFHTVPDYVGDSLELSRIAARTDADPIIFCGVRFMAETAKILNPGKTVLLPADKAGCSLAASLTAADVVELKRRFPGAPVVSYVNTYADVKAETDICCTSSNAAAVVKKLLERGHRRIIFLPDEYLASNVAADLGLALMRVGGVDPAAAEDAPPVDRPYLIAWRGRCEVHERFTVADVTAARLQYPGVVVLAHPECSREVVQAVDFSGSTKQMIAYVRDVEAPRYLLLTECSMGDNIAAENPHRELVRMCRLRCPHMKEITLEDTLSALMNRRRVIELDPELMDRARASLDRMIEIG